jgi:hypothetical protein
MNCANCTFAQVNEFDDGTFGLNCQRFPPTLLVLDGVVTRAWPTVTNDDVCGEWEGA